MDSNEGRIGKRIVLQDRVSRSAGLLGHGCPRLGSYFVTSLLGCFLALCLVSSLAAQVIRRLPSESRLPGDRRGNPALPAESRLPPGLRAVIGRAISERARRRGPRTKRDLPSENRLPPGQQEEIIPLPPETALPPEAEQPGRNADTDLDALLQPGRSPDAIPWLRLQLKAHVGRVRALAFTADSRRLCSAGDDKTVLVWGQTGAPGLPVSDWRYQRSIYWQIQRGNKGRILALATSGARLAIGGHGATGGAGEILLVNARTGELEVTLHDAEIGHRRLVVALAFSPDPEQPGLVSTDREGRTLYWRPDETGQWRCKVLRASDHQQYGAELARGIAAFRVTPALGMLDGRKAVVPIPEAADRVSWRLHLVDVVTGVAEPLLGEASPVHVGAVTALAAAANGSRLVSADLGRRNGALPYRMFVWDLRRGQVTEQPVAQLPLSLSLTATGARLLVGTRHEDRKPAVLQTWDSSDTQNLHKAAADIPVDAGDVFACTISPDRQFVAYAAGNRLVVQPVAQATRTARLRAGVQPPQRISCAVRGPDYRIAIRREVTGDRDASQQIFNASQLQLDPRLVLPADEWRSVEADRGDWKLVAAVEHSPRSPWYQLYRGDAKAGTIRFDPARQGVRTASCWVPDADGNPAALAVATSINNNIYLFGLAGQGACPLLRTFRGHISEVTSLSLTHDRRYLVSASLDATIRFWPLDRWNVADSVGNRWGAQFVIGPDQKFTVVSVRKDGPLYFRGVRSGDVLQSLAGRDHSRPPTAAAQPVVLQKATAMLRRLETPIVDDQLVFRFVRGRVEVRPFQMFPAWTPLASLYVDEEREWAFWTPAGYYDASFEGHSLFGWQVNRGLTTLPDFFLAAQMRKALERPEALSQLLKVGNLPDAFLRVAGATPPQFHRAIQEAYALKPDVVITEPAEGQLVTAGSVALQATVTIRNGQRLVPPKAFANGVLATGRRELSRQAVPGGHQVTYGWQAALPSQTRIRLQVTTATAAEIVGRASVTVRRRSIPWRRSRLFVAAAGINQYRDAQLPRLEFAVNNARQLTQTLNVHAATLYQTQALSLANEHVTRAAWSAAMQQYAARLRDQVTPDDLLVIFLSGHGVRDVQTNDYYYVTADARFRDIASRRYNDCMSFTDFTFFADIPCRKLVILDTCHSGALQPLRQRELKAALRTLQEDLVFTLTASEGQQEAIEDRAQSLGRFTRRLLEGLRGEADREQGNRDGRVTWGEVTRYVQRAVRADSIADPYQQFPTAGPAELLEFADFPVTAVSDVDDSASREARYPSSAVLADQ